ncbi:unnamed protein product [Chironomus riparius]|uniref:Uncharacterized protein n=1 Tax=Chironomus riparius TaxID=315576 RepID=A0A9N9RI29_9DIPT|nr:unnamed protein product [Chironomus riparius]
MIKYFVLIFVLLLIVEVCVAKPQIVSVAWPGGGYYGNFGYPFARRRPFVVVNPYILPPVPVYSPYYYY